MSRYVDPSITLFRVNGMVLFFETEINLKIEFPLNI